MNDILDLEIRKKIYDCIQKSPGLHFRELQRRINIAVGSLDYHLHFMHKNGLIKIEKDGSFNRYYTYTKNWDESEKNLLSLLRQRPIRQIVMFLYEHTKANPQLISEGTGISMSSVSFYMKKLSDINIISQDRNGKYRFYKIIDKKKILELLVNHKESFLDAMVDNFVDNWSDQE